MAFWFGHDHFQQSANASSGVMPGGPERLINHAQSPPQRPASAGFSH